MPKGRLQCRQVFWRSGRTASAPAGQARTGQRARTVAQEHRPARSVGARGGHEGPAGRTRPSPHPASESIRNGIHSARAGVSPVRPRTRADDDPFSHPQPSHSSSRSHVQPLPQPVPRSATALRQRPQSGVRFAWSSTSFRRRLEPTRVHIPSLNETASPERLGPEQIRAYLPGLLGHRTRPATDSLLVTVAWSEDEFAEVRNQWVESSVEWSRPRVTIIKAAWAVTFGAGWGAVECSPPAVRARPARSEQGAVSWSASRATTAGGHLGVACCRVH